MSPGAEKLRMPWDPETYIGWDIKCRSCGHEVYLVAATTTRVELVGKYHEASPSPPCHVGMADDWIVFQPSRVVAEYEPVRSRAAGWHGDRIESRQD